MRGEELKNPISQNSRKMRLGVRKSILIVKLSNDVSFPVNYTNAKYIKPGTGG